MRAWAGAAAFIIVWIILAMAAPGEEGRSAQTVWNLPTAVLFAALLFWGWRAWGLAVLANGLAGALTWHAGAPAAALIVGAVVPTVYLGAAVAIRGRSGGPDASAEAPARVVLAMTVMAIAALVATVLRELAQIALGLTATLPSVKALLSVALGDIVAVLSICPALLLVAVPVLRREALDGITGLTRPRRLAAALLAVVLVAGAALVIAIDLDDDPWYLFFIPLIHGALVFGLLGGALIALAVNAATVLLMRNVLVYESQLSIEVSMLCFVAMALLLGAVTNAQRRGVRAIRELAAGLEATVATRTAQLRASEQAALLALAMKQRFISAASHDLRQPLAALSLTLDSILHRGKLDPADAQAIELKGAVSTLVGALDTVLDLSRYEAGAAQLSRQPVNVAELLESIANDYRTLARHKGLAFRVAATALWIESDLTLARRALGNLVDNALRYTAAGEVAIEVEADGDGVVIAVTDTGAGMTSGMVEAVRRPYQRGEHGATGDVAMLSSGWGLGLAIVEQICRQLGLVLTVTSAPGRGSRFAIRFPRSGPGLPEPEGEEAGAAGALRNLRLLVIEDDPAVGRALAAALADAGANAQVVRDADAALRAAAAEAPDVILSDYVVHGSADGIAIITRIRQAAQYDDLPAILLSGVVGEDLIRRANAERIALLSKPVDTFRLIRTIEVAALSA